MRTTVPRIAAGLLLGALIAACSPATTTVTPWPSLGGVAPRPSQQTGAEPSTAPAAQLPSASRKPGGKGAVAPPVSANPDFVATEILGRPTDTSVTVNVVPAVAMYVAYDYGTASGVYTSSAAVQAGSPGVPLETLIDDLQPDTRYYYRIRYGTTTGPERTFVTQRAPGSTFTFDIQGDSHPERVAKQFDAGLYVQTLQSAAADQPDFYLTIGDDFSVDTLKTVDPSTVSALYVNQRQWLGQVGAPVFLVNGNHEQAALANLDGTPDNVAVWAQTARNAYYPQPAPDGFYTGDAAPVEHIGLLRDYYAFTWGDALFVVIDPYWHSPAAVDNQFGADRGAGGGGKGKRDVWGVTLGDAQYRWFRDTLESSTAAHKFVFAHHVNGTGRGGIERATEGEWGDAAGLAAHRPGWDKTIQQVMADSGVSVFFQGHDHLFARQELGGVVYQTLPSAADPNEAMPNAQAYRSGDELPASGHLRVTVAPDTVTVDYVRSSLERPDEVAFSYTVR
jgi:hypothetical protein